MKARLARTVTVVVLGALAAAQAIVLAPGAARPAAAAPAAVDDPSKPLSQAIRTMVMCGSVPGIEHNGTCWASPAPGDPQYLVVDRRTLDVVDNQAAVRNPDGTQSLLTPFLSYGTSQDRYFIVSAPQGARLSLAEQQQLPQYLGVSPLDYALPFSSVAVAGCGPCPETYNALGAPGVGGSTTGPAGQVTGYWQRSNTGNYVYTSPDYVPFDTATADTLVDVPVMRVGDRTYQPPGTTLGLSGFALLILDAANLQPVSPGTKGSNPALYFTVNGEDVSLLADEIAAHDDSVVLLQSFGTPHATSTAWNFLVDALEARGASRPVLNSLNNPGVPGLNSPVSYAFAAGPTIDGAVEAFTAPDGHPVALHGLLARQRSSRFAPFVAESAGLLDRDLYRYAYQQPTPFPMSSPADQQIIDLIQDMLVERSRFPSDRPLRDQYWKAILDPNWGQYKADLDQLVNPDPATYPRFEAVRDQLRREFTALTKVQSVLVSDAGVRGALDLANATTNGTLGVITDRIVNELNQTVAPPRDTDVISKAFGIIINVLTIVAGGGSIPGLPPVFGGTAAGSVVVAGALGLTGMFIDAGGGDASNNTDATRSAAAAIGLKLAAQFQATVQQLSQLAAIFAADYGKLMSVADDFETNPAYRFDNDTRTASVNTFAQAARQAMWQAILPASMFKDHNNDDNFNDQYPNNCGPARIPALGSEAMTNSYQESGGRLLPVPELTYFMFKLPDGGIDYEQLPPSQELIDALFSGPEVDVDLGGGAVIRGAGFDPQLFLDKTPLPDFDFCSTLAGHSFSTPLEPGSLLSPRTGNGQTARVGTDFGASLSVRLTDAAGYPADGQTITFTGTAGGATFSGAASVAADTAAGGIATAPTVTAGPTPARYQIPASGVGASTGFTMTNEPVLAIEKVVGDGLEAAPGTRFPLPLVVRVTDGAGTPVPDREVTFHVVTDQASFYDPIGTQFSVASVRTDRQGLATSPPLRAGSSVGTVAPFVTVPNQPDVIAQFSLESTTTPARPQPQGVVTTLRSPTIVGDPVEVQATVLGFPTRPPSGTVQFAVDGIAHGTAVMIDPYTGVAAAEPITDLAPGDHTITAQYSGDAVYAPATFTLVHAVEKLAPTVTVTSPSNGAAVGQTLTFTATVAGMPMSDGTVIAPTGVVRFTVDGRPLGSAVPLNGGTATSAEIASLDPGVHKATATYSGDGLYQTAARDYMQAVIGKWPTAVAITPSVVRSVVGQPVAFTADVTALPPATGTPTGNVRFLADFTALPGCDGLPLSDGTAACPWTYTSPAEHQLAVSYSGDTIDEAGQSPVLTFSVDKAHTTTTLTVPSSVVVGQAITLDAVVAVQAPGVAVPSGTMTFTDNGVEIAGCETVPISASGATVANASCQLSYDLPGSHDLTVQYSGDGNLESSLGRVPQLMVEKAQSTTTLALSSASSVVGESIALTASIGVTAPGSTTPGGTVTFTADGEPINGCTAIPVDATLNSAAAGCVVAFETPGTRAIVATYSGDERVADSTSGATTHETAPAATTTVLEVTPNPSVYDTPVHLRALVAVAAPGAGQPTGTVTFRDGDTTIATVTLEASGIATIDTSALLAGTHNLTAVFSGDGNFLPSTSGATTLTVARAATRLIASRATRSGSLLNPSVTVEATLSRADDGRFVPGQPITFTIGDKTLCTAVTDPNGMATCTGTPGLVTLLANGSYTATFNGDSNYLASRNTAPS